MSEIQKIVRRSIENEEFRMRLINSPESVVSEYNLTDEEEKAIINRNESKVDMLINGQSDNITFSGDGIQYSDKMTYGGK